MLKYVLDRLPTDKAELEAIAAACEVPVKTIEKIARGYTKNPTIDSLQPLYDYFRARRAAKRKAA